MLIPEKLGRVAMVALGDIFNLYNHLNVSEEGFLERSGGVDNKGFRITPSIGVKFEM